MRTLAALGLLLAASAAWTDIEWAPAPEVYKLLPRGAVEAGDGGKSTGDHYLLTKQDYRDFVFEFEALRLADPGEQPRSILVWATKPDAPSNRKAFFMDLASLKKGQRVRVRLVVLGELAALYLDGKQIATTPVVYGAPPGSGRVGFLHYYNYGYRYENPKITPLEAKSLPAPWFTRFNLTPSGVLRLAWQVPEPFEGLFDYRVYRALGSSVAAEDRFLLAETSASEYDDTTLRGNSLYTYLVVAASAQGENGPPSKPSGVRTGKLRPPSPPLGVSATRRLDGSVRVRWQFGAEGRYEGVAVYRGLTEEEALGDRAERVAARLPATVRDFLAPPGVGRYMAIGALDPDGSPAPRVACAIVDPAPPVQAGAPFPAKHPYLLYDAAQIARAKTTIATEGWARNLATARRRTADATVAKPAEIPREPVDDQSSLSNRLLDMGLTYQLIGDEKYARWVRDALVGYAQLYPSLPVRGGRTRLAKTESGLYEAMWFVPLVCAYDLVYESPAFSPGDHQLIQRDLIRLGADMFWVRDYGSAQDARAADLHYKCYNFQAWFDAAIGLSGLLLRDADMVEQAVDGPYGLRHLLAHDVHDDGVFWERSFGYHGFVLTALFPLLQAGSHCNLDLWRMAVPDDYNVDRESLANYCVGDGDSGPKSMRLMLDGPLHCAFPNLTWPVVADSGQGPLSPATWYRVGWELFQDPKYAWLLNRQGASSPGPAYGGLKDAAAQVRVAYDDRFLYVAARVADQVVRNSHDQPEAVWAGDALWMGLKWTGARGGPYDFIYGLSPGDLGQVPPIPALFTRFGVPVNARSAAQLAVAKSGDGYHLEAAIPLSEFMPKEGETGTPLTPGEGVQIAADFVLYDSDQRTGTTGKEKMLGWACTTDRYDSVQGGTIFFGPSAPEGEKTINAPPAAGLVMDGKLGEWEALPAKQARMGEKSAVMYDTAGGGPSMDDLFYSRPPADAGSFDLRGERFANNGVLEAGCSLFPSTGFALLRDRLGEDGLAPLDSTAVNLTYGPYGGGHGHPDKLSLVLFAHEMHLLPDFGSCGYDSPEKSQWTAQTISHNTVTVDQTSQLPADGLQSTWPCDTAEQQARGFLECFHGDPLLKAVQAWDKSAYPGLEQRRTVALMGDTAFDFFELKSAQKHTYDYALHIALPLQKSSLGLRPMSNPLGEKLGYQHIHQAQGSEPTDQAVQTTWAEGEKGLLLTMAPAPGTRLIAAESITTAVDRLMPMQIIRREATSTTFATVMQPLAAGRPTATWKWRAAGKCLAATDGSAFVAWSPEPTRSTRIGEVTFAGILAAGVPSGPAAGLSLVRGTSLQLGDLKVQTSKPVSLYVKVADGRPRELVMGYDGAAKVTVTYRGQGRTVDAKPRQTYTVSQ